MVGPDLLLILLVVLLILIVWRGPKMLPQIGEALGKTVKGFRDNVDADKSDSGAGTSEASAQDTTDSDDADSKPSA